MNPETLAQLTKLDRTLGALIKRVGPIVIKPRKRSPYEALVEAVIYQQLAGKAAAAILGRFKALFPAKKFPEPLDLLSASTEILRSAGLSGAKILAIRDIAAKTLDGTVPTKRIIVKMQDTEIIERLTVIRGVGSWTIEMFLISTLGRPDILPTTDYGVRKGFALTYGLSKLPTPKGIITIWREMAAISYHSCLLFMAITGWSYKRS